MKRNHIRLIIILGSIAIVGIILVQIYWLRKAWDIQERQFNQNVYVALKRVAMRIARDNQITLNRPNPVNQLSSNYYVVNVNVPIDKQNLERYLIAEFARTNVFVDFEYGIYDSSSNRMVYGNYISVSSGNSRESAKKELSTHKGYKHYFGVRFPSKKNYLAEQMDWMIIFSAILLLAVSFFTYALFIILKQKRLSEMQKDFINNMTHEFKTPIATVNISADVLADPKIIETPERLSSYAAIVKQETKRLNDQVEKVLQIARIEKRGFQLHKKQLNLHEEISVVVESSSISAQSANFSLRLEAKDPMIMADKLHLNNILYNLIDNAVKYNSSDVSISLETQEIKQQLQLTIADNGCGIDKAYQKKVFNKFYRIPTGNLHDVKGFGLGLYYVRQICQAHGWDIKLESEPGQGSRFMITIPQK